MDGRKYMIDHALSMLRAQVRLTKTAKGRAVRVCPCVRLFELSWS